MEQENNGSNTLKSTKEKVSHNKNVSLEDSVFHNLSSNLGIATNSNVFNLSNDRVPSLPTSPGVALAFGSSEEVQVVPSTALFTSITSKSGSLSRGSSPASRKKTSSESGDRGILSSSRRRSPLVARKVTIGSESSFSTPISGRSRFPSNHDDEQFIADDGEGRAASAVSNGSGGELGYEGTAQRSATLPDTEEVDGSAILSPNNQQKLKEIIDQLQAKIQKTAELIKEEQKARDDNVNEYLKLSANADRQQLMRIKAIFEKKNQKSAALIQQLQKKLDSYQKRRKEVELHGIQSSHRPKEVLRDVGHGLKSVGGNIRDGITGFSGRAALIGKPKEIAHLLKNKFGSADNIKEISEDSDDRSHHGSATLPPNSGLHPTPSSSNPTFISNPQVSSGTMGSSGGGGGSSGKIESEEGSECNSSITSESIPPNHLLAFSSPKNHGSSFDMPMNLPYVENIMQELHERQDARLREEMDVIKQFLSAEVNSMREKLSEDQNRCDRLEDQLNDLTELHQNEMDNLKTNITDMEEKVQYQSEERIRDLHEIFDDCLNRVQRMEHQQAQQQQQFLTLEGLENSNARMLFVKLINILLTLLQVFLLVIATVAGILTPLLQTRTRLISTALLCLFFVFIYLQLSEIRDSWHQMITYFTQYIS